MNEDYGPGVIAAMRDAQRMHDVDQAHTAALAEHAQREELLARPARVDAGGPPAAAPDPTSPSFYVDPREMVGLPAPDLGLVAAHQSDAELETRVRNTIYDREQGVVSRRLALDEQTWRDIADVVDCDDPGCEVTAGIGDPGVTCIVLVGEAWADGFSHYPTSALVDVRIPAAVTA